MNRRVTQPALADLRLAWVRGASAVRVLGKYTLEGALVNLEGVAPIRPFLVLASGKQNKHGGA